MFDYAKIDSIDPKFLSTFIDPKKRSKEAFLHTEDEEKTFIFEGKPYTIEYRCQSSTYGLKWLWESFAYELTGKAGKASDNHRVYNLKERNFKNPNDLLKTRTMCYDLPTAVKLGTIQKFPFKFHWEKTERMLDKLILPPTVPELTQEQVRQRLLCFSAMVAMLKEEAVIKKVLNYIVNEKKNPKEKCFSIAYLPIFDDSDEKNSAQSATCILVNTCVLETSTLSDTVDKNGRHQITVATKETGKIRIYIDYRTNWQESLIATHDLFQFPEKKAEKRSTQKRTEKAPAPIEKKVAKPARPFSYTNMDACVSMAQCLSIIETDKKGVRQFHREKNRKAVLQVDGQEYTVKYTMATQLKNLWCEYEEDLEPKWTKAFDDRYYDPDDVMKHMPAGSDGGIDPHSGVYVHAFPQQFPRKAAKFTQEQVKLRHLWFARACSLAGTDEVMAQIVRLMPRKKNGSLYRRRIVYLAACFYTLDGEMSVLLAQNTGDYEVSISLRNDIMLWHDELHEMHNDAASIHHLFD